MYLDMKIHIKVLEIYTQVQQHMKLALFMLNLSSLLEKDNCNIIVTNKHLKKIQFTRPIAPIIKFNQFPENSSQCR